MESLTEERDPLLLDPEFNKKSASKLKSSTSVTEVKQIGNCYCGKDRNLNILELLCATCNRWFHESCIGFQIGKLIKFSTNYVFYCKNCSPTGLESFRKLQATIPQMCMTAIANMQQIAFKEGMKTLFFDKDHEIIPFIEQYWESMTTMPRRVTQSWYSTVHRALTKEINTIFSFDEITESGQMYGLKMTDLTQIKPNYETIITKALRMSDDGANLTKGGRYNKRKVAGTETNVTGKKGRPTSDLAANVKLPAHGYPLDHPFNKDGYRYILAEPDPQAPFRQEFDESSDWAGKPIPGWLYRVLTPNSVLLTLHDRAPQLKISEDRLAVTGEKGYCMIRASHYVNRGAWYWEATIEEMPEGAATRIGWGQEYANLQAPLGFDKFGYSWRSRKGTTFHESYGKHYSPGYGEGDTIGVLIILPQVSKSLLKYQPNTFKDRPLVKFKSHLYYEDKDKVNEALKNLTLVPGSKIIFFKNGESQGEAYADCIFDGAYYPAISLYKNATVSVNFGPNFKYPDIQQKFKCKGMYDRAEELNCEQSLSDMVFLTENSGKLRLDNI